ncbi:MAG: hypothetical protein K2M13_09560 [Muribaculaceae bacterium]|nr:hypothetical protein [Muribaculaceae bacterium]
MKKIGSVADFSRERDEQLRKAFRNAIALPGVRKVMELYALAADSPTSRFWVSERRASEVMGAMLRGMDISKMNPRRKEMFEEIFRRFSDYRLSHPGSTIYEATFAAVNSPAPKFYLSPGTVKVLLTSLRSAKFKR